MQLPTLVPILEGVLVHIIWMMFAVMEMSQLYWNACKVALDFTTVFQAKMQGSNAIVC